jgi:hypothetical protein
MVDSPESRTETVVKIAVSSSPFGAAMRAGTLTHLEWLEGCASRLDADGIVFALADLPRRDREYAAQAKKVAVDLGLVPVALDVPGLLDPAQPEDWREEALGLAGALGVLLVRVTTGPPGSLPPQAFVETVETAKGVASLAKAANITVVVTAARATIAPDIAAVRHLLKDVDSAWLRYEVGPGDDRAALGPRDRVLVEAFPLVADPDTIAAETRAWVVVEGDGAPDPFARAKAAIDRLRR